MFMAKVIDDILPMHFELNLNWY